MSPERNDEEMKRIIIVGAGISGLSAGCYAAMNGYEVRIVEAHSLPGGLCTSWKRKGYLIDDSCHSLMVSSPVSPFYQIWRELGALQGRRFVDYKYFAGLTALNGREFRLYTDLDRLEPHMKELSPADAAPTEVFCRFIRRYADFNLPVGKLAELMGFLDNVKMMIGFYLPCMSIIQEQELNYRLNFGELYNKQTQQPFCQILNMFAYISMESSKDCTYLLRKMIERYLVSTTLKTILNLV